MRAALLEAPGQPLVVRDDVAIAEPRAGEVRVKIAHCGVCHSDLSCVDGVFPSPTPIVLGHEASGVVDAVGPGVDGLAPGDPVVLTPCPPCGHCYWCVRGEPGVCEAALGIMTHTLGDGTTGLSRGGELVYRGLNVGGFGEYAIAAAHGAVKVPKGVPLEVACVIGCAVQTGAGAVLNRAKVEAGASVLILGLGGIGLSAVQGARIAGAARILVSDPVAQRREVAKGFGATDLLDPGQDDVVTRARELTAGIGVDYAFETAGVAALVAQGVAATRNGGTTVCVGAPPLAETLDLGPAAVLSASGKAVLGTILGNCNSLHEIPRLLSLWQAGRLDLENLITSHRPLDEINDGMDDVRASRGIRTVLDL